MAIMMFHVYLQTLSVFFPLSANLQMLFDSEYLHFTTTVYKCKLTE